jgi:hypothetical protein
VISRLGRSVLLPSLATNSNDSVVRHYHEPVQRNKRKMNRDLYPASMNYITDRSQFNSLAKNPPERAFVFIAAYRQKVQSGDE